MGEEGGLAVVTGASSGIGAVYAERLAARGHSLLLVARRPDRLASTKHRLSSNYPVEVATLVADLERPSDLSDLEARVAADDVTFLVNNAGAGGLGRSQDITADQLERIIQLNITALTRLSHAALCRLPQTGSRCSCEYWLDDGACSGAKRCRLQQFQSVRIEFYSIIANGIRRQFDPHSTCYAWAHPHRVFSSQGVSESIFPPESYLALEQLVDAALAGLDAGESVTIPSMLDEQPWTALEAARREFVKALMSGKVAVRYQS
jgi:uncharacterized protein